MTATLTATPPPFDIHAQPTWIALGIGKLRREHPDMQVSDVSSVCRAEAIDPTRDFAWLNFTSNGSSFVACLCKADMGPIYVDEVIS